MADGPVVVMVSVEDWKVALGLIVAGLNEQAASAGSPEQLRVSGLVKDGLAKIVITSWTDCPAFTVAAAALEEIEKSAGNTFRLTAEEVEGSRFASPG